MGYKYEGLYGSCSKCSSAALEDCHVAKVLVPAGGYAKSLTLSAEAASDIRNQAVCRHKRSSREKDSGEEVRRVQDE